MSHHRGCEKDSVRNSLPTKIESTVRVNSSFCLDEGDDALLAAGAAADCFSLSTLILLWCGVVASVCWSSASFLAGR